MKNILIVEDNTSVREMIAAFMKLFGYTPLEADNGAEAVKIVGASRPDLILMDLQMPGIDGMEATQRIRQLDKCENIPIIALTAGCDEDHLPSMFARFDKVMSKPVDFGMLEPLLAVLTNR